MRPASASDMAADQAPSTASMLALTGARQRRAAPGYAHDAIARELAKGRTLVMPEIHKLRKDARIPAKAAGRKFIEVTQDGRPEADWKAEAADVGGFCVDDDFREAFEWARDWEPKNGGSVWLAGPVGRGKSLLAAAMVEGLLTAPVCLVWDFDRGGYTRTGGHSVYWADEKSLPHMQKRWEKDSKYGGATTTAPEESAIAASVLVVDDYLHREWMAKPNMWSEIEADELWERIISQRYDEGRPCIFTSNSDHTRVASLRGHRLASRIREMVSSYSCQVDGPDWRGV